MALPSIWRKRATVASRPRLSSSTWGLPLISRHRPVCGFYLLGYWRKQMKHQFKVAMTALAICFATNTFAAESAPSCRAKPPWRKS